MSDELARVRGLIEARERALLAYTTGYSSHEPPRLEGPERKVVLMRLGERLRELQRLLRAPGANHGAEVLRAAVTLVDHVPVGQHDLDQLDLDAAWELNDAFKLLLLEVGNDEYVLARLHAEEKRTDAQQWTWMYPAGLLEKLKTGLPADGREPAVRALTLLYDQRAGAGRRGRAQQLTRSSTLRAFGLVVLAGLTLLVGFLLKLGPAEVKHLGLAAAAGIIGAVVAGVRTLRDDEGPVRDADWRFVVVPVLGATTGVIFYALIAGGLFPALQTDAADRWGTVVGLGFVGGFSEPFFLGTIGRIVGSFEK